MRIRITLFIALIIGLEKKKKNEFYRKLTNENTNNFIYRTLIGLTNKKKKQILQKIDQWEDE